MDTETDQIFDSLNQLRNSNSYFPKVFRNTSSSRIPFKATKKELSLVLNEVAFTSGITSGKYEFSERLQQINVAKKIIYSKFVKVIGTSLKNCVQSDIISIDIEPDSTFLPLMCKMMIIVEGASYERGVQVLVRDVSVQVSDEDLEPRYEESQVSRNMLPVIYQKNNGKYLSNESINYSKFNQIQNSIKISNCGGSLSNLSTELSIFLETQSTKRFCNMNKSYLNLKEYSSTPYYQYQNKRSLKHNLSTNTTSYNLNEDSTQNKYTTLAELYVPMNDYCKAKRHINEKYILINSDKCNKIETVPYFRTNFKLLQDSKSSYISDKFKKFETGITYDLSKPNGLKFEACTTSNTGLYSYLNHQKNSSELHKKNVSSVTNLVLMHVVNGSLVI